MADTKITGLTALSAAPASIDVFAIVDVSDTTHAATGTTKKVTMTNVIDAVEANTNTFTAQNIFNNNVGVGTTSPVALIHISGAGKTGLRVIDYNTSLSTGMGGRITLGSSYRTDGTQTDGVYLEALKANATSDNYGYHFALSTRTHASAPAERMRVTDGGDVGIGTTSIAAQLHIDQSSTTGAQPVLYLDQGDVDQDLIEFVGGSSTGNATSISTDAAGSYAGRIQITVNGTRRWISFYADA